MEIYVLGNMEQCKGWCDVLCFENCPLTEGYTGNNYGSFIAFISFELVLKENPK